MYNKPQTLAWVVMILSLLACVLLAIGVPTGTRWLIQNATHPLEAALLPKDGIISLQSQITNEQSALAAKDRIRLSSDQAEAEIFFYDDQDPENRVAILQLFGETEMTHTAARTPIFMQSERPHYVALRVSSANLLRIFIGQDSRTTVLSLETPQGEMELTEGSYTLTIDSERTELIVNRGEARLPDPNTEDIFILTDSQLVQLTKQGLGKVQTSSNRDLLRNSAFNPPLETHWNPFIRRKQVLDESNGSVHVLSEDDRNAVVFEREGIGHIELGVSQPLNQDIRNAQALHVNALFRISNQSLSKCGMTGTECPFMIRIEYTDVDGGEHEWLQGFYTTVGQEGYPDICTVCEGSPEHLLVPAETWYPYTSPNLMPLLRARGSEPAIIATVDVYASGHSFASAGDKVSLLLEE